MPVAGYDAVSLSEMDGVELINRIDTKFVFRKELLSGLLHNLRDKYRILDIDGKRLHHYDSLYYDDDRLSLYMAHHNGRANRFKLRIRRYGTTGASFMEVKRKTNTGRTVKSRLRTAVFDRELNSEQLDYFRRQTSLAGGNWKFSVRIGFDRITLVSMDPPERLTLDLNLVFEGGNGMKALTDLVIAEVKQGGKQPSVFLAEMRQRHIKAFSISKYCMAVSMLEPQVRQNLFKSKHRSLKKLQENSLNGTGPV